MKDPKAPAHFRGWTAERMNEFMQSPEGVQALTAGLKAIVEPEMVASDGVCAILGDEPDVPIMLPSDTHRARSLEEWMGNESVPWNATARAFNEREAGASSDKRGHNDYMWKNRNDGRG